MKYCVLQNHMNQESWSSDESCLRPEAFIRVNRGNVNFMLSLISLCNHVFAYFRVYICVWDLTALGEDNLNSNRAFISLRYNVFELTCFFSLPQSNTCLAFKWGASSHSYRRRRRRPSISLSSLWRSLFNLCCSGHTAAHAKMAPFLNITPFLPPSLAVHLSRQHSLTVCFTFILVCECL